MKRWVILLLAFIFIIPFVSSESITITDFTKPAYNDLECERIGDKLNISWAGNSKYATIQAYFAYGTPLERYSVSEALFYGVTFDTWWVNKDSTSCKWGGSVDLSDAPQIVKDEGFFPVFELVESSPGITPEINGQKLYFDEYIYLDYMDNDNPSNKFNIYNETTVYVTDDGNKFHNTVVYDPTIKITTGTSWVLNQTVLNTTAHPDWLEVNESYNNGTSISPVTCNESFLYYTNLTWYNFNQSEYTSLSDVNGTCIQAKAYQDRINNQIGMSVRTKNLTINHELILYYDFDGDTNSVTDIVNDYDGAFQGNPIINDSGYIERGLYLDGVNAWSKTTWDAKLAASHPAFSVWIKNNIAAGDSGQKNIMASGAGTDFDFRMQRNTETFFMNTADLTDVVGIWSVAGLNPDWTQFHHVCGGYNGSHLYLWFDGQEQTADDTSGDITYGTTALSVGAYVNGANDFNGIIDNFQWYNMTNKTNLNCLAIYNGERGDNWTAFTTPQFDDTPATNHRLQNISIGTSLTPPSEAPSEVPDTTPPVINGTLNKTSNILLNDIINATYNFTDNSGNITWVNITINFTTKTQHFNFSINGSSLTTRQISQNFTIIDTFRNVINVSAIISDNSSNYAKNDTIITIDNAPPSVTSIILNATDSPLNYTTANLTAYNSSITDTDNDITKMVWDFRESGNSDMIVNMPFCNDSAYDLSSYSNQGTISGAIYNSSSGYDGFGGFEFDGIDDYIRIADDDSLDSITGTAISMWVYTKSNGTGTYPTLAIKEQAYWYSFDNNISGQGRAVFWIYNGTDWSEGVTTGSNYSELLNKWTHIAVSFDDATNNISSYENGVLTDSVNYTGTVSASNYFIEIGGSIYGYFNGTIDELRIFNHSLTDEQVMEIYTNQTHVLNSDSTSTGDNWTVVGYPTDSLSYGVPVTSNNVIIQADTTQTTTNFAFFALNSSQDIIGNISSFNESNIQEIEFMQINFTVADTNGIDGDISVFFTSNETNGCALGNNQSSACIKYPDYVHFRNGTNTENFNDFGDEGRGDSIMCSFTSNSGDTERNYTCIIDEHYNPNVWKHYPLNFSDVKWQDVVSERIQQGDIWRFDINHSLIPSNASLYKLDARINYTVGNKLPVEPILAFACNSLYKDNLGSPETSPYCNFVASKLPSDFQDDGTKFRALFKTNFTVSLGNLSVILFTSDSSAGRYYYMKTYKFLGTDSVHSSFSTNNGDTYTSLSDGYESDININWFFNTTDDTTKTLIKIGINDSLDNRGNSSINVMQWDLADIDFPPIVDIVVPLGESNLSGTANITAIVADSDGDVLISNISIYNGTTTIIFSNISEDNTSIDWDTTSIPDNYYNLTWRTCENETVDKLCGNDTHEVFIDNTKPEIKTTLNLSVSEITITKAVNFTANISDVRGLDFCQAITNETGANVYNNKSLDGVSDECSYVYPIGIVKKNVINLTIVANDTAGNTDFSNITFEVQDFEALISIVSNDTTPKITERVNITVNVTDYDVLGFCLIKNNQSGVFSNATFKLSGNIDTCSNSTEIYVAAGNVINWTVEINDSFGDVIYENSTKVTVATITDTTDPTITGALNKTTNNITVADIINATFNITDGYDSVNCTIVINQTGINEYFNFSFVNYNSGSKQECSKKFGMSQINGTIVNITGIAIDNNSNRAQNETIFRIIGIASITNISDILIVPTIQSVGSLIIVTANITTNDTTLTDVYAFLNADEGFTFLSETPQNQSVGGVYPNNITQVEWFLATPMLRKTYNLNISYTDSTRSYQGDNSVLLMVTEVNEMPIAVILVVIFVILVYFFLLINLFMARTFTEHGLLKLLFFMIAFWVLLLPINMAVQYNNASGGPVAVTDHLELLFQIIVWLNSLIVVYFMLWFIVQVMKKIGEGRRLKEMGQ